MDLEDGVRLLRSDRQISWPVQQAEGTSNPLFCSPWCACIPFVSIFLYVVLIAAAVIVSILGLTGVIFCGLPFACFYSYTSFWQCYPWTWRTDFYSMVAYLGFYGKRLNLRPTTAGEENLPVMGMLPKKKLKKLWVDYALNIKVPVGPEEQFFEHGELESMVERHVTLLPMTDRYDDEEFEAKENPVAFVMKQMAGVYPAIYQDWTEKHSDEAMTRMALCGLGAKRIDVVLRRGRKLFVVKTNMLSTLPVREGFERYGGDAYFDEAWRPVMIVDQGLGGAYDQRVLPEVVTQPGDEGWERAKFRWRSSLFSLVTLVDHLYGVHLQNANLLVTALREQFSADHPIRRFLTPFTYRTIYVNDDAAHNLTAPRSMGPRCFAFTEKGMAMAFRAAPGLVRMGQEVAKEEGGPITNIRDYVAYLRGKGIDTEYWRQAVELHEIYEQFIRDYLECYYPSHEDLVQDVELAAFAQQYFHQLEAINVSTLSHEKSPYEAVMKGKLEGHDAVRFRADYDFYVKWLATLVWYVTAGHEQDGAVEVYAQDVSWTAFKWKQGRIVGNKQTATAQALLMSFTSIPMPKLLGSNWTHLFPASKTGKDPKESFAQFQENLRIMAEKCDAYNSSAKGRKFPDCFPVYVNNPRVLEISVSV